MEKPVKTVENLTIRHMEGPDDLGRIVTTMDDGQQYLIALTQDDTLLLNMEGQPVGVVPVYEGVVLKGFRKAE